MKETLKQLGSKNITDNSNNVTKDDIFVAVKGNKADGHQYVLQALEKGASVVIIDKDQEENIKQLTTQYIAVQDTREALAYLASKKFSLPENIAAVTGTDGKTSTAFFYKELLSAMHKKAAAIGTMGVLSNTNTDYFKKYDIITTPGTLELYKILSELKASEVNNICLEASSHGIIQKRLDFIPIKAAAFTSFGRDHLDYHKDINDYLNAKLRLFNHLLPSNGIAVINQDMQVSDKVIESCGKKEVLTYGLKGKFIKIESIQYHNTKMSATLAIRGKTHKIHCNLFGDFQIQNLSCALALVHATGHSYAEAIDQIHHISSVPGRMQRVANFNIFIDYAHNPDALKKSLSILKYGISNKNGKAIVVFGCGGDRDKGKRSIMGEIADQLSDMVIITDDNPRTEDPSKIRQTIKDNCKKGIVIPGRDNAIEYAIKNMKDGDAILIAGKGHENYQILADKTIDFDDYKVAEHYANKHIKN
jgi:UDP-N-acetylmuramoyl-L-alanyl-D-glutamate--2,6-diaminopimelate ligase